MTSIEQKMADADRHASYGVHATNPLWMTGIDHSQVVQETYKLSDRRVVKIERLRLLGDFGMPNWEISYCYGRLVTGELVHVDLGVDWIRKYGTKVGVGDLIKIAKDNGRYAKGVGLLDEDGRPGHVISTLC